MSFEAIADDGRHAGHDTQHTTDDIHPMITTAHHVAMVLGGTGGGAKIREAITICLIQYFESDFRSKVRLKILSSGIILKTVTHAPFILDQSSE